jgi:hypothetical protein
LRRTRARRSSSAVKCRRTREPSSERSRDRKPSQSHWLRVTAEPRAAGPSFAGCCDRCFLSPCERARSILEADLPSAGLISSKNKNRPLR